MAESSGLSDVLRNLADGEAPPARTPSPAKAKASAPPPPPVEDADDEPDDEDDVLVAEVDEPDAPAASARRRIDVAPERDVPTAAASARRRAPAPPAPNHTLKEVGACLFTTFSVLMLLWAVWGTLILMEFEIWRYDQPGAQTMAKVSQVFYILAVIGLGYAVMLFRQVSQDKKKSSQAASKRKSRR